MCYETDTESDEISITSFSITCWTELNNTDIPYRTAEHYSYVNTATVTSDHNPHCTLTALHLTVGNATITGIAFCNESSLLFWQLILYAGKGHTAGHYQHVAHDSYSVWCFCVHFSYSCVYIYINLFISFTGIN